MQDGFFVALVLGRAFRVDNASPCRHPASYRSGGMTELLYQKQRSGRPRIINPETLDRLEKELQEAEGFNSYKEVHQWLTSCCEVEVSYRTVHQWARYRLKGKLKVPRPVSEKQKKGAVAEFLKNCHPW